MSKYLGIIAIFLITINCASGQSRFGVEVKLDQVITENTGHLEGGCCFYDITKESDLTSFNYSLGVVYKLNDRHLIKLHFGHHHNGRVIDLTDYDDLLGSTSYSGIDASNTYLQVAPSYSFRALNKKVIIPVEVGINWNSRIKEENTFYVGIKEQNYDYELSVGVQYRFVPGFLMGMHGIYSGTFNDYLNKQIAWGSFKPRQLGVGLTIAYGL